MRDLEPEVWQVWGDLLKKSYLLLHVALSFVVVILFFFFYKLCVYIK